MATIEELIKRFDIANGNRTFTQKDLLKYIIGRIEDIDKKIDDVNMGLTNKIDNHITSNENRMTAIETTISNIKWIFGGIGVALLAIFIKLII